MAITLADFNKIWASTSPLTPYEFNDSQYKQGWNFVGSTPPARQMWDSIQKKNDEKFKYLRDNFGTPNIVTSSSQMTDTDKVYVYMGSEAGWNSGHWYYYDEGTSSWADGGVYNSVAFVTDTTLSIAGQPADAKAVGDALALKADLSGCTFTGNVTVGADFSVTGDTTLVDANVTDLTATNVNTTDIVVSGDATIGGNASVTGDISSANVTTSANGTIGGNLSVSGTTTLTGDVSASADLSVAGDSSLTNLSVSGTTALAGTSTAPTPSAGDNSTKIATTEFVNAKAGNYLPLSGGTLTGVVNGVTPPNGDNSTKIATTEFVNAKAGNYLPLSGGSITGDVNITGDLSVSGLKFSVTDEGKIHVELDSDDEE